MSLDRGPSQTVMTERIRISPSAGVTRTETGVVLRSDLGTFQVRGEDVGAFLDRMVPLLDGSKSEDELADALSEYSRESVTAFVGLLRRRGLVEAAAPDEAGDRGSEAFFRSWQIDPEAAAARLRAGKVLFIGLEPWGATAALELAVAGLGAIHLVDDGVVGSADVPLAGAGAKGARTRRDALADRLVEAAPGCHVDERPMASLPDLVADGAPWSLAVVAVSPRDTARIEEISRVLHQVKVVSSWSELEGTTSVLGPVVVPGKTACRVCAATPGLNPLGAVERAGEARTGEEAGPSASALAQLLGHRIALEVILRITQYTMSELGGRVFIEDRETLATACHTLVRLPWCPVCG